MVTIVVPNHNEPQIDETLSGLFTLGVPVVVANDPYGRGIGWAIREGLKDVRTPWVLFAMADGSEDIESLAEMIRCCGLDSLGIEAIFGDRWGVGGVVEGYPWLKRLFNRLGNVLIAGVMGIWYFDWTDLAKAYQTDRLRQIRWSDDFRCEVEIPIRYLDRRAPLIAYVPMHWRERHQGVSAYRLRHAWASLVTLGKVVLYG